MLEEPSDSGERLIRPVDSRRGSVRFESEFLCARVLIARSLRYAIEGNDRATNHVTDGMKTIQLWLPSLGRSLNFPEVSRDAQRAFKVWRGGPAVSVVRVIRRPGCVERMVRVM